MKAFLALIGLIALLLASPAFAGPCTASGCADSGALSCDLCPIANLGLGCGAACVTPPLLPALHTHSSPMESKVRFAAFTPRFTDATLRPEAPPPR